MTISAGSGRMDYTGNGNTATYSYNFKIFNKSHLMVTTRNTDGVEDELAIDTDYIVSGVGEANGGSITLTAGNLASNYHLTIRELVPIEQATDLRNQGDEYREVQEDALDYLTKIDRQQQDEIDRSFKLSETITGVSATLPVPEANKLTRWNSLATALENVSVASLGSYIAGSTMKVVSNVFDLADSLVAKLVTNGDSHDHSGGDGGQIDHTTLSNKGTNTHAALDTEYALTVAHRANISNPHSVTKTQIGLSNVTNDAQVKVTDIGTLVLSPTGDGSGLTGIVTSDSVTNITGNTTITAAQMTGRVKFYNSAQAAITLPAATAGLLATFEINHSGGIRFIRNGTDTFTCGGESGLTSLPVDATVYDIVVGGKYELICYVAGTWTVKRKGVQPRVYVTKNANQTGIASNTPTKVTWQTITENNNGDFERVAADRWDCSIPGRYRFSSSIWTNPDAAGQRKHIILYKNGIVFKGNNLVSTSTTDISIWGDWSDNVIATKNYELYTSLIHAGAGGTIYQTDPNNLGHTYFVIERESD